MSGDCDHFAIGRGRPGRLSVQDNCSNCAGVRSDRFTLGLASRRPWRRVVRKVFNTEETGRTTENHGVECKLYFARSASNAYSVASDVLPASYRGRDACHHTPPAQIPAGGIPAPGSHLGCLTAKRTLGHGCGPSLLAHRVKRPVAGSRDPARGTCFPGSVSGACRARSRSPRPLPLAPPTPPAVACLCSPASQLLRKGLTSHARASSASTFQSS
jgi:hypothetical protein